jgi:hypothetical protein
MKRTSTSEEKRHLAKVAAMGCIVCSSCYGNEDTPAQAHHCRSRHGWGRSGHLMTIPLCPEHHTGKTGVHNMGRDEFETMHGASEFLLLAVVHERLGVML